MPAYRCPHCDAVLSGARVEGSYCPSCKKPLPDHDAGANLEIARERAWTRQVLDWGAARSGFAAAGIGLICLGVSVGFLFSLDKLVAPGRPPRGWLLFVIALSGLGVTVGVTLALAGMLVASGAPGGPRVRLAGMLFKIFLLATAAVVVTDMYLQLAQDAPGNPPPGFGRQRGPGLRGPGQNPGDVQIAQLFKFIETCLALLANLAFVSQMRTIASYFRQPILGLSTLLYLLLALISDIVLLTGLGILYFGKQDWADEMHRQLEWLRAQSWSPWAIFGGAALVLAWAVINLFALRHAIASSLLDYEAGT